MRTVNQATQTAWNQIEYTKVRVYLPELEMSVTDEKIGSIKFKEAISDTDNRFFGGCIASLVDLTLNDCDLDRSRCPLVAVPDHGRLISESDLASLIVEDIERLDSTDEYTDEEKELVRVVYQSCLYKIAIAPTILEATE